MLKENNEVRKLTGVDVWHNKGYTGKGVTIVLLDNEGMARNNMKAYYTDVLGDQTEIGHASNVGQVAHEFAPDAKVLMLDNTRNKDNVFEWIKAHKDEIDLINVSLAGLYGKETPDYLRYEELGIPLICASGNDDYEDKISYPAAYPFTIAIGAATRKGDSVAGYSNEGAMLDAVAPSGIYVQRDDGYTWSVDGTSFAAPTACGMLACYIQWRKEHGLARLPPEEARTFIRENCKDIEDKGFDKASGYGLFCLPETLPKEVLMSTPYNRTIQSIVIHHMGDGLPPEVSILQRWNPEGLDYPEYDYGIEADGTVRVGRPLNIQGAHTLSDRPPYSQKGYQWWNRNSIGIGLAGDFTKYPMPLAQFYALVSLVNSLMSEHGLTLDNVYPHGQVTYTDCPGCTYSKVPALMEGKWSYDNFEQAILRNEQQEVSDVFDVCVVYYTPADFSGALVVANENGGCAMFCRNGGPSVHVDVKKAKKIINIGGPELKLPGEVWLSGDKAKDTLKKVAATL
ncbi:S8 family serine peptidase [Desulfosporosinus sp. OT]|uniref:S8 family serine peptidase n=1 Tax=Desulfosporosinus sp. OT TaxID=913865 RepID=UPI000223A920|nr:S8 family serine peptidase [Desulfosporosinus sp. OT]EGW39090.1 subtilase family protein [Desulfosporosinus sp. OT]